MAASELPDIGAKAVAFVLARTDRMAARRKRNNAAFAFNEENGSDACFSDSSGHPKGYSVEFLDATREAQGAYEAALQQEKSSRQKLYAAVRKHVKGGAK